MEGVILEDVSLRDGLQLETRILTLPEKISLFRLLAKAGLQRIQIGSFVHPQVLPQLADTDALIHAVASEYPAIRITALAFNARGVERALACGLRHLTFSVSASDTHSMKNVRRPAAEALSETVALIGQAVASGLQVRAGVQCAFGCVYEGAVAEDRVLEMVTALAAAGAEELYLADTTGMADPLRVKHLVAELHRLVPEKPISLHLHDTRGLGLANLLAGYEAGVGIFDVAVGGLGGCPFVKGAAGNIPAEDAVHLLDRIGGVTGIDLAALCRVVEAFEALLGRGLPGHMHRVLKASQTCG